MFGRQKRDDREILQVMRDLKARGEDADAMAILPPQVRKRIHEAQRRDEEKGEKS